MIAADVIAHIYRDQKGVAWIDQTNVKVIEVVLDHLAYGWSAEEMHRHHPHLSMAQIHAALSYYHDHKGEIDRQMKEQLERHHRLRTEAADQLTRAELLRRLERK